MLPVRLLLRDRFPSATLLRNYHGPVAVVVDGWDTVVPEQFGLRLYEGYAGPKRLWRFPNGVHTQIMAPPEVFWSEVIAFWQNPGVTH
jgi:pimeloyl-ACP methyl ester carboxylesterase